MQIINKIYFKQEDDYNLYLTVLNNDPQNTKFEKIVETLKSNCQKNQTIYI